MSCFRSDYPFLVVGALVLIISSVKERDLLSGAKKILV